jgi:hypothetical protein
MFQAAPAEEENRLLAIFRKLTASGKRLLLEYAEKLLGHEKELLSGASQDAPKDPPQEEPGTRPAEREGA